MESKLPKCAVLPCPNAADPRYFARDVNARPVMICDGHEPMPKPTEVAARPPDPTALDIAARVVRNSYSPTPGEVESVAHALIVDQGELADLRALAFALYADIELSPELLKVKQRLIDDRHAKQVAKAEAAFAAAWDSVHRDNVSIVRCRRCGFETFPFADAAIEDHVKSRCVYVALPSEFPPERKVHAAGARSVNGMTYEQHSDRMLTHSLHLDDLKAQRIALLARLDDTKDAAARDTVQAEITGVDTAIEKVSELVARTARDLGIQPWPSEVPSERKVKAVGAHIVNGKFQSDKYPTCPAGKVPLSVEDPTAQDLLWQYAHRRRAVDAEFADDLEACLVDAGYLPTKPASTEAQNLAAIAFSFLEILTPDQAKDVIPKLTNVQHDIILEMLRIRADS